MCAKSKMGRPKLPKGEAKKVFPIRLSDAEKASVEAAAKKAGQRPSEWARKTLLSASK